MKHSPLATDLPFESQLSQKCPRRAAHWLSQRQVAQSSALQFVVCGASFPDAPLRYVAYATSGAELVSPAIIRRRSSENWSSLWWHTSASFCSESSMISATFAGRSLRSSCLHRPHSRQRALATLCVSEPDLPIDVNLEGIKKVLGLWRTPHRRGPSSGCRR